MNKGTILGTIAGAALLAAAPFSLQWSQTVTLTLDSADARIGRPLTPMSVAGVPSPRGYSVALEVCGASAVAVRERGLPAGDVAQRSTSLRRVRSSSVERHCSMAVIFSASSMATERTLFCIPAKPCCSIHVENSAQ